MTAERVETTRPAFVVGASSGTVVGPRLALHGDGVVPDPGWISPIEYERHEPEKALLHQVVREQLETFLANARQQGAPIAHFVEREIRAYLECGVLAHGFLRLHCDGCGHDRVLAFSCKGRGLCPSCGGRRMADTAAHLVDRVLPETQVRQWVLTLPFPLRYRMAWDAKLTSVVLRCFMRALFADQRRRARAHHGIRGGGTTGAITAIQRFGSALNLTPHFHTLVLDGVYPGPTHSPGHFLSLPPPSTDDVARVMAGTARRIKKHLERSGIEQDDDVVASNQPLLAMLSAASIRSRIATGPYAGLPWRRLGDQVAPLEQEGKPETGGLRSTQPEPPERCVRQGGMSLHADVAVPARDRKRLERLCRYILRPAVTLERLEALPDGMLSYQLKNRWRDGTTHILMERRELLERLAPSIPPPRAHQVRYHGILAPCAAGRSRVVPAVAAAAGVVGESRAGESAPVGASTDERAPKQGPEAVGQAARVHSTAGAATAANSSTQGSPYTGTANAGDRLPLAPSLPTLPALPTRAPRSKSTSRPRRLPWTDLLKRVFGVEALRCPGCGDTMRVMAVITNPDVARRILECLKLPSRAPPLADVQRATKVEADPFEETPTFEVEADQAEFHFDQRPAGHGADDDALS